MTSTATTRRQVVAAVRALNPVADPPAGPLSDAARATLAAIMTKPVPPTAPAPAGSTRPGRRRLGGIAAAGAAVALLALALPRLAGSPATAAPSLPAVIGFAAGTHEAAVPDLTAAADAARAAQQSHEPVRHSVVQSWALSVDVTKHDGDPVLIAGTRELWLRPDGTGRIKNSRQSVSTALGEALHGRTLNETTTEVTPAVFADVNRALPSDPGSLRRALDSGALGSPGRVPAGAAYAGFLLADLREGTTTPAQNAAIYTVLSGLPDVFDAGMVTDRAGRPGRAVGVVTSDATSPTIGTDYLIFDPRTGALLEVDTVYTPGPPKPLHLPAGPTVAAYSLFVRLDSAQNIS